MRTQIPTWFATALQYFAIVTRKTLSASAARLASGRALLVALVLGLTSWAVAADPASYVVKDLGVLPGNSSSIAFGINQRGDVVGWSMVTTVGQIVALFSVLCRNCRNQAIADYLGNRPSVG